MTAFKLVLPALFDLSPLYTVELPKAHRADIYPSPATEDITEPRYDVLVYMGDGHPARDFEAPCPQGLSALGVKRYLEIWVFMLTAPPVPKFTTLGDFMAQLGVPQNKPDQAN